MKYWYRMPTSFGTLGALILVMERDALTAIGFTSGMRPSQPPADGVEDIAPFRETIRQLEEYFAGTREEFDLPLAPQGTAFQQRVWQALLEVRYGASASYSDIAHRIGNPNAVRAVGLANGRNPIPIVIPCHRVIGKNGTLTGYGGGLPIKQQLLALEGIAFNEEPRTRALFA